MNRLAMASGNASLLNGARAMPTVETKNRAQQRRKWEEISKSERVQPQGLQEIAVSLGKLIFSPLRLITTLINQ